MTRLHITIIFSLILWVFGAICSIIGLNMIWDILKIGVPCFLLLLGTCYLDFQIYEWFNKKVKIWK